jgi:putative MATE family efflux protein
MKENKMGVMPMRKLILNMALPMILSMLIGALYNVVDSLFVSRFSEDALSAVSLAFPVQNIIIAIGTGIGVGVNSLLSRYLGEKKLQEANQTAMHGLAIGLVFYALILLFGIFGVHFYYTIQTDAADIVSMGYDYLTVVCIFSFGQMFQMILEKLLQATGRTTYTMIMQIVGAVVNIILDPILIFGFFGFPAMGAKGAAIATVIAQIVSMVLGVVFNLWKNKEIQLSFRQFRFDFGYVKTICVVGIPTMIMQSMSSVMCFGINKLLLGYSTTATAVFGAYFKLQTFVYMAVFGLNNALIPIVAYNYGAKNGDRIKSAIVLCGIFSAVIGAIGTLIMEVFPAQLIGAFSPSEEMYRLGVTALRILALAFTFGSVTVMVSYALQGLSRGISSLVISAGRQVILLLPLAVLLGNLMGMNGIWWSFLIAEVIDMVLALIFLRSVEKKVLKSLEVSEVSKVSEGSEA